MTKIPPTEIHPLVHSLHALLLSVGLLLLGQGLLTTLLPITLSSYGFSPRAISAVGAGYFAGFAIGGWRLSSLIRRVGQIRAFGGFAAAMVAITLLLPLMPNLWVWAVLRAVQGACHAGVTLSIESWLSAATPQPLRGRILAIYMVVAYGAMGAGQFLLGFGQSFDNLFNIGAILLAASVIPVALSDASAPPLEEPKPRPQRQLLDMSPLSVFGAFGGGAAMGAFYALGPLFGERLGLDTRRIALLMAVTIIGGILLQFPTGWLSDRFNRRTVIIGTGFAAAAVSALIVAFGGIDLRLVLLLLALYGGTSTAIYPMCLAHAVDYLSESEDTVAVTGGLLLSYGVGAGLGPIGAGVLFGLADGRGLFVFTGLAVLAVAVAGVWEITRQPPPPPEEQADLVVMPRFTPQALEMDPRSPEA